MVLYFKGATASPAPPCSPGQERQLLKDVLQKIDNLFRESAKVEEHDLEPLKQQAISALRSLAFTNKQDQPFDHVLREVERVRLSGMFGMGFPVSQTLGEQLEAQLRQLRYWVTFAIERLPANESKKKENPGARALRHEITRLYKLYRNARDGYVFLVCAGLDEARMPILPPWVKELERRGVSANHRNWEGAYTDRDLRHRVEAYLSRVTKEVRLGGYKEQSSLACQTPGPTPRKSTRHSRPT